MSQDVTIEERDDWWVQMVAVTVASPAHLNEVAQTRAWAIDDPGDQKVMLTLAAHPNLSLVSAVYLYQLFPLEELTEPWDDPEDEPLRQTMLSVPTALRDGIARGAYAHDGADHVNALRCDGILHFADSPLQREASDWALPADAVTQVCGLVRTRQTLDRVVNGEFVLQGSKVDAADLLAYMRSPLRGKVRLHPTHPLAHVERLFRAKGPAGFQRA